MKWYNIGLELGIAPNTLDSIRKANNQNPDDCLTNMIKDWLKNGKTERSWAALAKALKSRMVGYAQLSKELPQQGTCSTDTGHSSSSTRIIIYVE